MRNGNLHIRNFVTDFKKTNNSYREEEVITLSALL